MLLKEALSEIRRTPFNNGTVEEETTMESVYSDITDHSEHGVRSYIFSRADQFPDSDDPVIQTLLHVPDTDEVVNYTNTLSAQLYAARTLVSDLQWKKRVLHAKLKRAVGHFWMRAIENSPKKPSDKVLMAVQNNDPKVIRAQNDYDEIQRLLSYAQDVLISLEDKKSLMPGIQGMLNRMLRGD